MSRLKRLDHVIVAVRDRQPWIPLIERVLALEPGRMLEGAGAGAGGFSNAEFAIGDGFIGVVEPAGETSQLHRFLDRFGDGFYAMSIDVGDVAAAADAFDAAGVGHRGTPGQGLVWAGPRNTHGVVYQVIDGMLLGPGTNPHYLGLGRVTVVVEDLQRAVAQYRAIFDLGAPGTTGDDPPGTRGALFRLDNPDLEQSLAARRDGIEAGAIAGYEREEFTHMAVAAAVMSGAADAGLGILAAARALDLDFVPLLRERYDLVIPRVHYESPLLQPLLAVIRGEEYRNAVAALGGYGVEVMGAVRTED